MNALQIQSIIIGEIEIPLLKPYISALRSIGSIKDIVVTIRTRNGLLGYGSATATPAITGDNHESIVSTISNVLAQKLIGRNLIEFDNLINLTHDALEKNTSAKAAIDVALYDLFAKYCDLPLYRFLGSGLNEITTDMTVGLGTLQEMVDNAKKFVSRGALGLKIKTGIDSQDDLIQVKAIRQAVGKDIRLCVDANQGWNVKQALKFIRMAEKLNLDIIMIEQPVRANDLAGLKFLRDRADGMVFADEACFSPRDALKIISHNIADGIGIKLMKSGGIYMANVIYGMASSHNIPCMAGCMLESPIGITAMASFAVGKKNVKFVDLGTLVRLKHNPVVGGVKLDGAKLILADKPGLGIASLGEFNILQEIKM